MSVENILIGLYLLLGMVYAYDRFWRTGSLSESVFSLVFCVFLPVVGFLILWVRDYVQEKNTEKDYSELLMGNQFFQDELKILRPIHKEKELNRVPMAEALSLNHYELRRKMVMDTLAEENVYEYMDVLKEALDNPDAETSHYASSIIMMLQAKVQKRMLEQEKAYETGSMDAVAMDEYENELFEMLEGKVLGTDSLYRYIVAYEKLSERLLNEDHPKERYLQHRIQVCFWQENYRAAGELTETYLAVYPESEDAVLCKLKLCIYSKDYEALTVFFERLPGLPVILTQKTLEYIRFFRKRSGKRGYKRGDRI